MSVAQISPTSVDRIAPGVRTGSGYAMAGASAKAGQSASAPPLKPQRSSRTSASPFRGPPYLSSARRTSLAATAHAGEAVHGRSPRAGRLSGLPPAGAAPATPLRSSFRLDSLQDRALGRIDADAGLRTINADGVFDRTKPGLFRADTAGDQLETFAKDQAKVGRRLPIEGLRRAARGSDPDLIRRDSRSPHSRRPTKRRRRDGSATTIPEREKARRDSNPQPRPGRPSRRRRRPPGRAGRLATDCRRRRADGWPRSPCAGGLRWSWQRHADRRALEAPPGECLEISLAVRSVAANLQIGDWLASNPGPGNARAETLAQPWQASFRFSRLRNSGASTLSFIGSTGHGGASPRGRRARPNL